MIKVNLLPVKAARRMESIRIQVLGGIAVLAVVLGMVVAFHGYATAQVQDKRNEKTKIDNAIAQLKQELGDFELLKAQREDLLRQKAAIEKLQRDRKGPAYFLREMSDILTRGKGPTFDHAAYEATLARDPNAAINTNWDPKRVWLMSYVEQGRIVKMHVAAKSGEDVAEFCKRLKLSAFFASVEWQQNVPQMDSKLGVEYLTFDVNAVVNY